MTTKEVANRLVELCRKGEYETVYKDLYHADIISQEPEGTPWGTQQGMAAIAEKGKQWGESMVEMHGSEVSEPIVADNYFSCVMKYDATFKESGRVQMEEVCVYEVKDGKVTKEQFFYTPEHS